MKALIFALFLGSTAAIASSTAFDPQAKGLGEYLRSRRWPDTRSCRCAMSECPNKRKMASMLDAIACSNRPMLATSR